MSRIVLSATNSQARYWGLRALQYSLALSGQTVSYVEIQTLAVTMKIREFTDRRYTYPRKARTVTLEGTLQGQPFSVVCEQQMQKGPTMVHPEWFLLRFTGHMGQVKIGQLVKRFEEEGCPQPPLSY